MPSADTEMRIWAIAQEDRHRRRIECIHEAQKGVDTIVAAGATIDRIMILHEWHAVHHGVILKESEASAAAVASDFRAFHGR